MFLEFNNNWLVPHQLEMNGLNVSATATIVHKCIVTANTSLVPLLLVNL